MSEIQILYCWVLDTYQSLRSVVISSLYYEYIASYKAGQQEKQYSTVALYTILWHMHLIVE